MSFGWSAGDIVAAVNTLVKVGKALKQSGGAAAEYQEAVTFLTALEKTLSGLQVILENNPGLEWEAGLLEQVNTLTSSVEDFKKKIAKYDPSLGADTERRKARRIAREVQFALSDRVKELRVAITQPQLVLDVFINLQTLTSVLDVSKSTSLSQDYLRTLSENLTRTLPCISQGIEALSKDIRSKVGDVSSSHQASELHIRDELNEIKSHLTNLGSLQKVCLDQNQVGSEELSKWHSELQKSIQALQACVRTHLDFLSNKETKNIASSGNVSSSVGPLRILLGTLRLVSNGVASGIGALVAISSLKANMHGDSPVTGYVDPHYDDSLSPPSSSSRAVLDTWDMAFEAAAKSFAERNVLKTPRSPSDRSGQGIQSQFPRLDNEQEQSRDKDASLLYSRNVYFADSAQSESNSQPFQSRLGLEPEQPRYEHFWIWSCCNCQIQAGMYVKSTPTCPECAHPRCESCNIEHHKIIVGVKHESRFRPGIKRLRDDNLPIYEWFPKVDFAALKQKGINPSDGIEILKAEICKGTLLDPHYYVLEPDQYCDFFALGRVFRDQPVHFRNLIAPEHYAHFKIIAYVSLGICNVGKSTQFCLCLAIGRFDFDKIFEKSEHYSKVVAEIGKEFRPITRSLPDGTMEIEKLSPYLLVVKVQREGSHPGRYDRLDLISKYKVRHDLPVVNLGVLDEFSCQKLEKIRDRLIQVQKVC